MCYKNIYFIFVGQLVNNPPERQPGPRNGAENCNDFTDFWNILFDQGIQETIVNCTNIEIEDVCSKLMADEIQMQTYHHTTDITEINAFIGLFIGLHRHTKKKMNVSEGSPR